MFLVRSIRRRLVTGFAAAMALMLTLAGAGVMGLIWHLDAVNELSFLLYESPDRDQLSRAFSRIAEEPWQPLQLDLSRPSAVETLRKNIRVRINEAWLALGEFRRRVERLDQSPELYQQREKVLGRLDSLGVDLQRLYVASGRLVPEVPAAADAAAGNRSVLQQLTRIVAGAQQKLDHLPAYQHRHWLEVSLEKERRRSARLRNLIIIVAAISFCGMLTMMFLGFRWVCNPLRRVAQGACRIGNGDTRWRLSRACTWDDEFADLVTNVNKMADRFLQAEEDLLAKVEERSEQLVRSQRLASVGFLAAGVAHEINNPLSSICVAAESLMNRVPDFVDLDDPTVRLIFERLQMIRKESLRCRDITARLKDFSRDEKSGKSVADLTQVVREVLMIVSHMQRFDDRTVHFDQTTAVFAECNAAQMKQVILNLTANALQATQPSGNVWLTLRDQVDFVVISITDDGCGMDEQTVAHIFDPFWTTKETGQGTGLGLSISHNIVAEHGGTLTGSSPGPGSGSEFRIRLPKRQAAADADRAAA